jgi:transposase
MMRYELTDYEWAAIRPMLPNKARGLRRVDDRRVLNGICCCDPAHCSELPRIHPARVNKAVAARL